MTHKSCIYAIQRDGEHVPLFAGGNPLPFFWLMLLDEEDITRCKEQMQHATQEGDDSKKIILILDKLHAITKATARRNYINIFFQSSLELFDDWIYFLQIADFSDMKIYMDLTYVASFYHDSNLFFDSLTLAIVNFDEKKESWFEVSIPGICGHEARNKNKRRFADFSQAYDTIHQKDIYGRFDKQVRLHKYRPTRKTNITRMIVIFLLLLASIAILAALLIG